MVRSECIFAGENFKGVEPVRTRTAVEDREAHHGVLGHARDGLLDVSDAQGLLLWGVADDVLGDERLADDVPPVSGRFREDGAERGRRAWVRLRVDVGGYDAPR